MNAAVPLIFLFRREIGESTVAAAKWKVVRTMIRLCLDDDYFSICYCEGPKAGQLSFFQECFIIETMRKRCRSGSSWYSSRLFFLYYSWRLTSFYSYLLLIGECEWSYFFGDTRLAWRATFPANAAVQRVQHRDEKHRIHTLEWSTTMLTVVAAFCSNMSSSRMLMGKMSWHFASKSSDSTRHQQGPANICI